MKSLCCTFKTYMEKNIPESSWSLLLAAEQDMAILAMEWSQDPDSEISQLVRKIPFLTDIFILQSH